MNAPLPIVEYTYSGDQEHQLRRRSKRVLTFNDELHRILDTMFITMRHHGGVGLAAPQVGIDQRVCVIDCPTDIERPKETMRSYELINPKIVRKKGLSIGEERCLSIPGVAARVIRANHVRVNTQDRNGNWKKIKAYGLLARILQHEIDHLNGILMIDRKVKDGPRNTIKNDAGRDNSRKRPAADAA